jgi:hypothetical protein
MASHHHLLHHILWIEGPKIPSAAAGLQTAIESQLMDVAINV